MVMANGDGEVATAAHHNHGDSNDVPALLARIAALESENKQLREQQRRIISSTSLSQSSPDRRKRRSCGVYFDGFKTLVEDDDPTDDEVRKAFIAYSRRWRRSSAISSDKDKIYNYAGNWPNAYQNESGTHFTLGENRYTKRSSEEIEEIIKATMFSSNRSSDKSERDDVNPRLSIEGRRTMSEGGLLSTSDHLESGQERHFSVDYNKIPVFEVPKGVELFLRIHALSKKFSSRASFSAGNLIKPPQERLLYDQFAILSIDPSCSYQWFDKGSRFLDAFVLNTAHCIDCYPTQPGEGFAPEELSTFCCLDGINARLMPQTAASGAMALDLFADEHKLLAFTDGNGLHSFGIAITVYQEVSADVKGYDDLLKYLQNRRRKRSAVSLITRWWRSHAKKIGGPGSVDATKQTKKSMSQKSPKLSHRVKNLVSTPLQHRRKGSEGSKFSHTFQSGMKKIKNRMTKRVSFSGPSLSDSDNVKSSPGHMSSPEIASVHEPPRCLRNVERPSWSSDIKDDVTIVAESTSSSISNETRVFAKESFDLMIAERDVILAQKCYVMIGGDQGEQFLQLRLLKHLIEIERHKSDSNLELLPKDEIIRHKYLQGISRIHLSKKQARARLHSELSMHQQPPTFNIDLPAFDWVDKVTIPLPLPHVANDWGVAQLFLFLNPEHICSILKLLLVERSVLVVGESSELVTSCICALIQLMKPFQWASNWLPLLPVNMIDFVSSPVPFVAGMVCNNTKYEQIIQGDEVKDAMKEGLSVVNLNQGKLLVTREKGIKTIIEQSPAPIQQLSSFKDRLRVLKDEVDSSLVSFNLFLMNGMKREELVTLNAIRNRINAYVKGIAGTITSSNDGWRQYGEYKDGQFDFYPSLFINPMREQLQLQEMLCHSQLFIEYVNNEERKSKEIAKLSRSDDGKFIAEFVYFHWLRRKRNASK
ncbi:hypothetical protein ACHAXM_004867 [Skeletonema potamos]|jgi:hypothetical protein